MLIERHTVCVCGGGWESAGESLQFLFIESLDQMPSNIVADVILDLLWGFWLTRCKAEPHIGVLYESLQI